MSGYKYVNVYEVTREYGGPEEGGWWYNDYECIYTEKVEKEQAEKTKNKLRAEYGEYSYGDIYSAAGGMEIVVLVEDEEGERDTGKVGAPRWE